MARGSHQRTGLDKLQMAPIRQHGEVVGFMKSERTTFPCYTLWEITNALSPEPFTNRGRTVIETSPPARKSSRLTTNLVLGDYQTRPFFDKVYQHILTSSRRTVVERTRGPD